MIMPVIVSIILGIGIGYLYGLSFAIQQKRVFFSPELQHKRRLIERIKVRIDRFLC